MSCAVTTTGTFLTHGADRYGTCSKSARSCTALDITPQLSQVNFCMGARGLGSGTADWRCLSLILKVPPPGISIIIVSNSPGNREPGDSGGRVTSEKALQRCLGYCPEPVRGWPQK